MPLCTSHGHRSTLCTMLHNAARGAQRKSVLHNVVMYSRALHNVARSHKPGRMGTQTKATERIFSHASRSIEIKSKITNYKICW